MVKEPVARDCQEEMGRWLLVKSRTVKVSRQGAKTPTADIVTPVQGLGYN